MDRFRSTFGLTFIVSVVLLTDLLIAQTPGTPSNVQARVSGTSLNVSWNAPSTGPTPTGYRLDFRSGATVVASAIVGATPSAAFTIPPGIQGAFSVTVTALAGSAAGSPSAPATFVVGGSGCTAPPLIPTIVGGSFLNGTAEVSWNDSAGATSYFVQAGTAAGQSNLFNANVGNTNAVAASGLPANFSAYIRVGASNLCGSSPATLDLFLPAPRTCSLDEHTACIFERFRAELSWRLPSGAIGRGTIAPGGRLTDGARFSFSGVSNTELTVKILNSCSRNNRYGVFASAATDVGYTLTVTDTQTGNTKQYHNPQGIVSPPVEDTDAFATCP